MEKRYFTSHDARSLINIYGFALFPVHGIVDGRCTCGNVDCTNAGKHPATNDGFKSATKDIDQLLRVWNGRKHLNVGVATGAPSNIFVIDIDSAEGEAALQALGTIPSTLTATTGKGKHLYFEYPNEKVITKRGILSGVDVRGDGGYVCGVGTNHASGAVYEWVNPLEQIAKAPDFILGLVLESRTKVTHTPAVAPLLNLASSPLRLGGYSDGWTVEKAYDLLSHINPDCGYDEWVQIGMALQSEGFGFEVWDAWSRGGTKYDAKTIGHHWKSFKTGGGVTFGTLVKMAQDAGWKPTNPTIPTRIASPQKVYSEAMAASVIDKDTGEITDHAPHTRRALPILYASDVSAVTEATDFVEGILRENEFSVIYGESNCGKTFFMLDLAMHVALGKSWRGRTVDKGGVIYAALEGGHGTKNRIVAFREYHQIHEDIPLAVIPTSINFLDSSGDVLSLIDAIKEAQDRLGNVKLIVIDTLARAISGGDENSSSDMGQLIINADALREVTGAHISFIHHCGKDSVRGARGHSSLRAAVDTEIEISRPHQDSPSIIKVSKQREMDIAEDMAFRLERVVLGQNRRLKEVTSCVVLEDDIANKVVKPITLTAPETFLYNSLVECLAVKGVERAVDSSAAPTLCVNYFELNETMAANGYKELMDKEGNVDTKAIKSSTNTARISLRKKGKISFNRTHIWIQD